LCVLVLPIACLVFTFYITADKLDSEGYTKKWKEFYKETKYKTRLERAFKFFFVLRRLLILSISFGEFTKKHAIIQIGGLYTINTIITIY